MGAAAYLHDRLDRVNRHQKDAKCAGGHRGTASLDEDGQVAGRLQVLHDRHHAGVGGSITKARHGALFKHQPNVQTGSIYSVVLVP